MADDHRRCDELFVAVEQALLTPQWDLASRTFTQFQQATLRHFETEETLLFPAFEAHTGMHQGPTLVMRQEHVQLRELMQSAQQALAAQDADAYSGEAETLLIMLQQHNLKEENILYPMCDQHLSAQANALLPQIQNALAA